MKKLVFFVLLVFCLCSVNAAPSITSSSNSLTNGQNYTIAGNGFTAFNVGTDILAWDDFDSGISGQTVSVTPEIGSWTRVTRTGPYSVYSNDNPRQGGSVFLRGWNTVDSGNSDQMVDVELPTNLTSLYINYNFRYHISCRTYAGSSPNGVYKVFELFGKLADGSHMGDYAPGIMTGYGGTYWDPDNTIWNGGCSAIPAYCNGAAQPMSALSGDNVWQNFELIAKQSPISTPTGSVKVTYNYGSDPVASWQNIATRTIAGTYWGTARIFYGIKNTYCTNTYTNSQDVDDLYVAKSWARIEIGNAATYTSSTHREIQIPTSWSSNSISFNARKGSFGNEQLYLFVVDENNVPSVGYPITFSGTTGPYCGDSTCNNGETCSTCSQDCGACAPVCGDGTCNGAETCSTCAADCGSCSNSITQTINLAQGWNLFTLRVNASATSSSLQSLFVMRYENNQWQTAWSSGSAFNLEPLRAYYVYSTRARTITITGTALNTDYNYPLKDYSWNLFAVNRTATFNSIYSNYSILQQELDRINSGFSYTALNAASSNLASGEYYWVNIRSPQNSPAYTSQVRSNDFIGNIITFIYHIFN